MQEPETTTAAPKAKKPHIHLDYINLKNNQIVFKQTGCENKKLTVFVNDVVFAETEIKDETVIVTSESFQIPASHSIGFKMS